MNRRDLLIFLGLQVLAIFWAMAAFRLIESRVLAGAVAGGYFVISGLFMTWRAWRWQNRWSALSIYPLLIHVFGVAIPMLVVRALNPEQPFENVKIWGLTGPQLHQLSGWVFSALMMATGADLVRVLIKKKHPQE